MSINWWNDTQNMGCLYNAILFSHKMERGTDTYYNMEIYIYTLKTLWWMKDRHKDGPHIVWFHSYELPKKGKYTETESKSLVPRG